MGLLPYKNENPAFLFKNSGTLKFNNIFMIFNCVIRKYSSHKKKRKSRQQDLNFVGMRMGDEVWILIRRIY